MPLKIQQDETLGLNLTPMIDILFLLIIFFMVATKFDELERNIQVAVPQVANADESPLEVKPLVVSVDASGAIELDGSPVTLEQLTARLKAARASSGNPSVIIRGDGKCAFQGIASPLAACREAGISELGITVRIAGLDAPRVR